MFFFFLDYSLSSLFNSFLSTTKSYFVKTKEL